jgi:7-carboxy-7-deazaguanine synthase
MLGTNPKRPPEKGDGSTLQVQAIFPTFQGEGPFVAIPAFFIRLGGCNLACSFCDTEFESFSPKSLADILAEIQQLQLAHPHTSLIVLTGGEPLRQPVLPLCEKLIALGFTVQLETNGTLYQPLPREAMVVCSPKKGEHSYFPPHGSLLPRVDAWKILASKRLSYDFIPDFIPLHAPLYIQPIDEYDAAINAGNLQLARQLVAKRPHARVNHQLHKYANVP